MLQQETESGQLRSIHNLATDFQRGNQTRVCSAWCREATRPPSKCYKKKNLNKCTELLETAVLFLGSNLSCTPRRSRSLPNRVVHAVLHTMLCHTPCFLALHFSPQGRGRFCSFALWPSRPGQRFLMQTMLVEAAVVHGIAISSQASPKPPFPKPSNNAIVLGRVYLLLCPKHRE